MRPFASLMPYPQALAKALAAVRPVTGSERMLLQDAPGRLLAEDVLSPGDLPPIARAAMDGYAVAAESVPGELPCAGASHAGIPFKGTMKPGTCIEIATGAAIPKGADAVVMVEETVREGKKIRFSKPARPGQNLSPKGEDLKKGQPIARSGQLVHPGVLAALAASGQTDLKVIRRPRVAHATGGDEVVKPGQALKSVDGVYDSNSFAVSALARAHGGEPRPLGIVPDTIEALREAVDRMKDADLVVFSGGTSVGPKDFTLDVLGKDTELIFRGVAVKPGRPTMLARLADGRLFLGLPGYPVSCLMMGYAFLVPMLRKMAGVPAGWGRTESFPAAEAIRAAEAMHTFVTVRVEKGKAKPVFRKSSTLTSFSTAEGIVELGAGEAIRKGEVAAVRFL